MGKTRVLVLKSDRDDFERFYINHMQKENVNAESIYKYNCGLPWKMMVCWLKFLDMPFQSIWYRKWKKDLRQYNTVILFDRILNWNIIEYIKKNNPEIRIIVWYWNIVSEGNIIPKKYRKMCEVWSFDKNDCRKYSMKSNCQFYFFVDETRGNIETVKHGNEIDFFFIGSDKGRIQYLEKLDEVLRNNGYRTEILVLPDKTSKGYNSRLYINNPLEYDLVLKKIRNSRCIIELIQKKQTGMSIRTLEALFYGKKLMTNNSELLATEIDPNNYFLISDSGEINIEMEKLDVFMKKNVNKSTELCKTYSYEAWLNNFYQIGEQ